MLSKTGVYVVRAFASLATVPENQWKGTALLAQEIDAPVNYLSKLLLVLAREGLVLSQKGAGGGVRLARPATEISLFEALNPFEGFSQWCDCIFGKTTCVTAQACAVAQPCGINERWSPVRRKMVQFLKETTAADLAKHPDGCL